VSPCFWFPALALLLILVGLGFRGLGLGYWFGFGSCNYLCMLIGVLFSLLLCYGGVIGGNIK